MIPLYKFPRPGADRERAREESFARSHIAQRGAEDFARQDFWPLMRRFLKRGKHYVDVQSGTGGWVMFLHDEGYTVEGVDPSRRVAHAITEYAPDIRMHVASSRQLPYSNESVDGIVAIGALETAEREVAATLKEWRRVLREDGTLFFQVPAVNYLRRWVYLPLKSLEYFVKKLLGRKPVFAGYLFTPADVRRLAKEVGFAVIEMIPHELPVPAHFGLYHDWPFLRGAQPYELNALGKTTRKLCEGISPRIASTGLFVVAKALPPAE